MDVAGARTGTLRDSSPTKAAQVLGRMSLNSPPARADNPRQVKRVKLLAGEAGVSLPVPPPSSSSAVPAVPARTPATVRKPLPPSRAAALDRPSPMPSWGVNLRDASAGETLGVENEDEPDDPSDFYPSFQLDCLRQPYGGPGRRNGSPGAISAASPTSTTMDEDEDDGDHLPPPSPARLEMVGRSHSRGGGLASAFREASDSSGGGGARAGVPETPIRRPGSGARNRVLDRSTGGRGGGSCSPIGGYGGRDGSAVQDSPVKKRSVGRWRMSEDGRRHSADQQQHRRGFHEPSPLRSNRNPFSPDGDWRGGGSSPRSYYRGDATSMPAPAPRSRRASAGPGGLSEGSPMDTGDAVDGPDVGTTPSASKGDEGGFLRRVSVGSCASLPNTGGKKPVLDATNPSPCDVADFIPITPCRGSGSNQEGFSTMVETGRGAGDDVPMSPISRNGGSVDVHRAAREGARGRFATDFEVKEVIGAGTFGTVYKVRSRVDGCLYAVKCSRRRFKGDSDRQRMLMEVYALAAVCDSAQETINIVRYHQAWIEDERLYIQTELCETSLEKQLESGLRLEINGVYAFLRQTLLGLEILHQHKLVHLDIKPGNIFVKNGQYKLGDFGLVTPVHVGSGADVVEGDSRYMSKELLNDDHSNLTKCDVFSLGITLYEIISGRPLPPNGEDWHSLRSGKVGMPMGLPSELSKTLQAMMHPEPSRRPSAAELLRIPCLQSEMERQLNDQKSKLSKERTRNSGLLEEVSALIQKQSSQRSGRLSRTITWDNSYFASAGVKELSSSSSSSSISSSSSASSLQRAKALGGASDQLSQRGVGNPVRERTRFSPSPFKAKPSGFFGEFESNRSRLGPSVGAGATSPAKARGGAARARVVGAAGTGFRQGMAGLSSLEEKEEEDGMGSPMKGASTVARGQAAGGGQPATFERLRQTGN